MRYHHPVYTPAGLAAQRRWDEVSGVRRTHYCGAYWGYGFHEDGVWSALRVCARFGRGGSRDAAERALRGLGPPSPPRAGRARVPLPAVHALPRPRRAARAARPRAALVGAPARAGVVSRAVTICDVEHDGPVRLLTHVPHLRPPVQPGQPLLLLRPRRRAGRAGVAEVTNTPWGERHAYVLDGRERDASTRQFHVSPFLGMDREYHGGADHARRPAAVHMESAASGGDFDATLALRRRELSAGAAAALSVHVRCAAGGRGHLRQACGSSSRAPPTTPIRRDDRPPR